MVLNQQRRIAVDLDEARGFVGRVRATLKLGRRDFNVCFVDDARIAELNARYRRKARPTDVLSFPWNGAGEGSPKEPGQAARLRAVAPAYDRRSLHSKDSPLKARRERRTSAPFLRQGKLRGPLPQREFSGFLGDIVISVETARRNARAAGHSTAREIRWLILHGALHLLGYDHETDRGEMTALELALRERLRCGKR